MLVLRFSCRLLLTVVAMLDLFGSVRATILEKIHFVHISILQPTESELPEVCFLGCQGGRHRAMCGTNGRLYKSACAFQRARCINSQLRPAPRSRCLDPALSKCQLVQRQAREALEAQRSPATAVFVPRCRPDGHFLPLQCMDQTGYCWCSTPDGQPISGSSVFHLIPNCTDHMAKFTDGDSALIHDETTEPVTTVTPRKPSGDTDELLSVLTAPPSWMTIQMNSDPTGSHLVRREAGGSQTCEHLRASLLSQLHSESERFIPECTADGRYSPVQCHAASGYCWCVRAISGRPLPGTSVRYEIPKCSRTDKQLKHHRYRVKPLPGFRGARRQHFLRSLVRTLQQKAQPAESLSLALPSDTTVPRSPPKAVSSTTSSPGSFSSSSSSSSSLSTTSSPGSSSSSSSSSFTSSPGSSSSSSFSTTSSPGSSSSSSSSSFTSSPSSSSSSSFSTTLSPGSYSSSSSSFVTSSSTSSTSSPSSSSITSSFSTSTVVDIASSPPVLLDSEPSGPEAALRWHFLQLDVDSSGVLSEREARPLRRFLRRRLKLRRCAKRCIQHCDGDGDRGLTLEELRLCLGV
ncbi:uncharacterized protein LOC142895047 [Nelusetta ayraudi]|uniref:uncharacterized protein LOC142895047 n=1 Tax=Nelusetta ayraudi TaxID=303726 RepID=UPI003F71F06E